jgi:hypothetical protein
MNPILKKLHFKGQPKVLVLQAPPEFEATREAFEVPVHKAIKGAYDFVIAFAKSQAEAKSLATKLKKALTSDKALLWLAYPKGSSKKYSADLNRDSLHALMEEYGFDGVSIVALDDDWSAMRFKLVS